MIPSYPSFGRFQYPINRPYLHSAYDMESYASINSYHHCLVCHPSACLRNFLSSHIYDAADTATALHVLESLVDIAQESDGA